MAMRAFLIAVLVFWIGSALSQEVQPPAFKWQSLKAKSMASVQGNQYELESAGREWSARVALNARRDITRFEVRPGDQWDEDANSGEIKERSEFDGYRQRWRAGSDVWGAYSFFIEPGATYRADWNAINQMHGSKVRPFHVHFNNGLLGIVSETIPDGGSKPITSVRYMNTMSRNAWHNVVFHLRENASGNGRLEFWIDGEKIVDFNGSIGATDNQAYWKFGIYRGYGPIAIPLAIQFANMEVGTADRTARVAKPLEVQ